jgi:3-hydroxybutyryl-CoA dehydrogenase
MNRKEQLAAIETGVVGLGLMGSSIIVALLLAGHRVKGIAPLHADMKLAGKRIADQLDHCRESGFTDPDFQLEEGQLEISEDYSKLAHCEIVLECVIEDITIKQSIYGKIAAVVSPETVIASNTSAIAISVLQPLVPNPERFLGVHWAEPAYATRFMEITCGDKTKPEYAEWVFAIAHHWGKEPTLLRKDIRGFITNRLMYAVYREIFALVEKDFVTIEDADKCFRYDAGSWITLMGIFRKMDHDGLKDWSEILNTTIPQLSNAEHVPAIMQKMVDCHARGTQNQKGLYAYTKKEAREWEEAFALFNKDIFQLASMYPLKVELQADEFSVTSSRQ